MRRYLRLLWVSLRASLLAAMAYRWDFLVSGIISLFWMVWALVPLAIVFDRVDSAAGWSYPEAMIVVAWFTGLKGILEGVVTPSLVALIDGIRTGTLDFVLLKPADSQFLMSTARFTPYKIFDLGAALAIVIWAVNRLGERPGAAEIAATVGLLIAATTVMYSIFILVACAAFYVVRLDNLSYLFMSIFDFGRWPVQIFRGGWRLLFTFVLPLAVMTTDPAMALLGRLDGRTAAYAVGCAVVFFGWARFTWKRSVRAYTSASS
jgi:ABC-2 type transport system permease protein